MAAELGTAAPEGADEGAEAAGADDRYFGRFVGRHEPEGSHGVAAAATPLAAGGNPTRADRDAFTSVEMELEITRRRHGERISRVVRSEMRVRTGNGTRYRSAARSRQAKA